MKKELQPVYKQIKANIKHGKPPKLIFDNCSDDVDSQVGKNTQRIISEELIQILQGIGLADITIEKALLGNHYSLGSALMRRYINTKLVAEIY